MSTIFHHVEQPEFEVPVPGCDRQLRWPGMVAASAAPLSQPTSPTLSWCELSPLHAGMALVGAGRFDRGAAPEMDAAAAREVIWATAIAGGRLTDVVSTVWTADRSELAVVYAIVDPLTRRFELAIRGTEVSALIIQHTRVSSAPIEVRSAGTATALTFTAPEDSTLLLIAHPGWYNPVAPTVQQVLDIEVADSDEQAASLRLCGLLRNRARWSDAAVAVVHFARPDGMPNPTMAVTRFLPGGPTLAADHQNQASERGAKHPATRVRCRHHTRQRSPDTVNFAATAGF